MSPLIIVGILLSTALADVSHVLSGHAHPPADPIDINSLALSGPRTNGFQSGNPNDFWWMASNSPLKEAYDYYKKCSDKGGCLPPLSIVPGVKVAEAHFDPIDLKKNPFLNGEFQAGVGSSSSSFSSSSASSSSSGCSSCAGGVKGGDVSGFHTGGKIDISNNPFLTGKFATAGNGDKIKNENGFIGVQPKKPAFATSHPLSNKKPFATSPPNGPQSFVLGGDVEATECKGKGYLCVDKGLCVNGVVNTTGLRQIRNDVQYCNVITEICCRLESTSSGIVLPNVSTKTSLPSNINDLAADITAGKSSVTGSSFKFSGGAGSSPGQIQVLIGQSEDIKPQVYHNGESGSQPSSSTNKATRDATGSATAVFPSTVDYSGVQISNDIRFASTIRGPPYLPPIGPPQPSTTTEFGIPSPSIITYQPPVCPPGTSLTPSGICDSPSTPIPPCPFGTIRTPDGNCERPIITTPIPCPPGTILSVSGFCEAISTPAPPCPPGTIRTPSGVCERPITTPRPCPPGTILTIDGGCARPTPPPSPRPCPPGSFLTSSGICESPRPPVTTPIPRCPFGTIQRADGSCGRPPSPPTTPPPSPKPCPAGTFLTAFGICQAPSPPPTPSCPFGTIQRPDGTCVSPGTPTTPLPCPPGTILTGSGLCAAIVTPTPRPQCPPGTILSPSGICSSIVSTVGPQCPPGTYLSLSGVCERPLSPSTPKPPPRPFETTTSRDYLPPVTPTYVPSVTQKPYQPSITTQQPFRPSVTQKIPSITPIKPFIPSVTPSKPFQPPVTPQIPITTQKPYYPQGTTPTQPPVTTLRPYQPSSPRPHPFLTTQVDVQSSPVCANGQVPSPSGYGCVYPTTTTQSQKGCLPGQKLTASGVCQYPTSTPRYDYPTPTTPTVSSCGPGKVLSSSGSCIYPPRPTTQPPTGRPSCSFGQVLSPSGDCIYPSTSPFPTSQPPRQPSCGFGQVLSVAGVCEYPSQSTPRPGYNTPKPTCLPGQTLSSSGICIYSSESTARPSLPTRPVCKVGQVLSTSGVCIYPGTSVFTTGRPACLPGQELSVSGVCEYITTVRPTITCGPGQVLSSTGLCVYSSKTVTGPTPQPTPSPRPSCPTGQVPSPSGYGCVYSSPSSTPRPVTSTSGYDYPRPTTPGQPTGPQKCGPGEVPRPSGIGCEYPRTSKPTLPGLVTPSCPPGQVPSSSGYGCVYSSSTPIPVTTTSGYDYPRPTAPICQPGQIVSPTGSCIYPSKVTPGQPTGPQQCGPGQVPRPSGSGCEYPKIPTSTRPSLVTPEQPGAKPSCPPGQIPSPSGYGCVYSSSSSTPRPVTTTSGYDYPRPTTPFCQPGQVLSPTGSCIYPSKVTPGQPTRPQPCGPGQVPRPSGIGCEYPKTPRPTLPGLVTPEQPGSKPSCPPGQVPSPSGYGCVYPSFSSTPRPVTTTSEYEYTRPTTQVCQPGQTLSPTGSCIYSTKVTPGQPTGPQTCGPGQVPRPSGIGCEYPRTPKPTIPGVITPSCPPGQVPSPSGYGCVYSSSSTPRPVTTTSGYDYPKPTTPFCQPGQVLSPTGSCIYSPRVTPGQPTGPQPCGPGQVPKPSGVGCEYPRTPKPTLPSVVTKPSCPFGTRLSPVTNQCLTPGDFTAGTTISPQPSCRTGQVLSSSGVCIYPQTSCRPGQIKSSTGSCVYPSDTTTSPRPTARPSCGPGQIFSSGLCVYPSQTTPIEKCGPGELLSASGNCIPGTTRPGPTRRPSCPPGQVPSASGFGCEYQPSTGKVSCPFGQRLSPSGSCEPPRSTQGYDYPKPTTQPSVSCPVGQVLAPSGYGCIFPGGTTQSPQCPRGQVPSRSGIGCEYPKTIRPGVTTKPPASCPFGTKLSPITNECIIGTSKHPGYDYPKPSTPFVSGSTPRPIGPKQCPPGQILSTSGSCIYSTKITTISQPSCGPGQVLLSSGLCSYQSTPRPSTSCREGQILSDLGVCIYPGQSPSTPRPGFTTESTYPRPTTSFVPGYSTEITTTRSFTRTCGQGQVLSEAGICVYSGSTTPSQVCGRGQVLSPSGACVYSSPSTPKPIPSVTTGYSYPRPTTSFVTGFSTDITTLRPFTRQCGAGQVLSDSGVCIYAASSTPRPRCGSGQVLSPFGTCVYSSSTTPTPRPGVTTGYTYSRPTTSFIPGYSTEITTPRPFQKQCGPGQILSDSGVCIYSGTSTPIPVCARGQVLSSSGVCIYPSSSTPRPGVTTARPFTRQCGPGQVLSDSGVCIYAGSSTPSPACGRGQVLSSSGICVYLSSSTPRPRPGVTTGYTYPRPTSSFEPGYSTEITTLRPFTRQCGPGQVLSDSGVCIYAGSSTPSSVCALGQVLSSSGVCIYPSSSTSRPSVTTVRPFTRQCGPGQVLSDSGVCIYAGSSTPSPACGRGQVLSSSGICVYPSSSTPRPRPGVTTGYTYPRPTTSFEPGYSTEITTLRPFTRQCGPGQVLSDSGVCIYSGSSTPSPVCRRGQVLSSSGACVYPSSSTPRPGVTTLRPFTKQCGPGQVLSDSGVCIYAGSSTPSPACGRGQVLSPSGTCVYPSSSTPRPRPGVTTGYTYPKPTISFEPGYSTETTTLRPFTRQCRPGQELSASGVCIYSGLSTPSPTCGRGQVLSSSGTCVYPSSSTPRPGVTTSRPYQKQCGPGQVLSDSGVCIYPGSSTPSQVCGRGQVLSSSGVCVYPSSSTPRPRPGITTGYTYPKPTTSFIPGYSTEITSRPFQKECGPGQILSNSGVCIYSGTSTPSPLCERGQVLSSSGVCIYPSSTPRPGETTVRPFTRQCGPGQVLSDSGLCIYGGSSTPSPACRGGQVLSPSGVCVYPSSSTPRPRPGVTTGYTYPRPTTSFEPGYSTETSTGRPFQKQCGPGQLLSDSGACVYSGLSTPSPTCRGGQVLSSSGVCIYPSSPRPVPDITTGSYQPSQKPRCRPGQELSESGLCIYSARPTYPTTYPGSTAHTGYHYPKPSTPFEPEYPIKPGSKQCGPDEVLSPSGSCVYSSRPTVTPQPGFSVTPGLTPRQCGPGEVLSPSGSCVYSSRPTVTPQPGFSVTPGLTPRQCGPGQVLSPSGSCVYSSRPTVTPQPGFSVTPGLTPRQCGPGQVLSPSGSCVYSSRPTVTPQPGFTVTPGLTPRQCGPGQVLSPSGSCVYSSRPTVTPQPGFSVTPGLTPRKCGPGQVLSPSGSCVYSSRPTVTPQPGFTVTPGLTPRQCGPGQVLSPSGSCVYSSRPTVTPQPGFPSSSSKQCPPGAKPSAFGSGCEYPRPTSPRPTSQTFTGYKYPKPEKPFEPQPCPPGQRLSPVGTCEFSPVVTPTPVYESSSESSINQQPSCPPGSKLGPTGACQYTPGRPTQTVTPQYGTTCPFGTVKTPSGLCQSTSSTPGPISPGYGQRCPPGTVKTNSGLCERPSSPTPPQRPISCPPGSSLSPSGDCRYPNPTPSPGRPTDTINRFTPSYPTKKPYRPSSPPSNGYVYETPTPTFGYPSSTLIPNSNSIDNNYVPAPTTPSYLPPLDRNGSSIHSPVLPPERPDNTGEQDRVSINRVPGPTTAPPPRVTQPYRVPPQEQNNEPPVGCAAALKCVQEIYCTAEGVVSPVPVVLTKEQELLRVPTTVCRDEESGIIGKCCRDPNYKDPWPSANLVNGVDDGQYKEDNLYGQRQDILSNNRLVRSSNGTKTNVRRTINRSQNAPETCGERHQNSKPQGSGPLDANFAEYPWQAMILRDSNRSLLCGGAIIRRNAVLTAAHCVEGLDTSDVLIKGGEWKLGIDEEPLPFQIVKVGAILRHPEYVPGSYKNDLAVLILREKLRPSKNVGSICLPEPNQVPTGNCVATGWGKRILQLHAKGALMHHINVDVIDSQKCQQTLQQNFQSSVENYGPSTICGVSEIDHCKVDYGSALACPNSQGQYTLTGIYAWDTGCKDENQIGGYIAPDVEWIESTVAKSIKELKRIEREYLLKSRV